MRLLPVDRRPGEPEDQWEVRSRWAARGLLHAADLSSGDRFRGSSFEPYDANDDTQVLTSSGWPMRESVRDPDPRAFPPVIRISDFRPPWEQGLEPAPVAPVTVSTPKASEFTAKWAPIAESGVMIPPDVRGQQVPIWAIPTPPTVSLVDPATAPIDFDFETHAARALHTTLMLARIKPGAVAVEQLPMRAENVFKHLKRGAELAWTGGKWVVMKGASHILGPVGLAGDIWDAYRFLKWVADKQLPPTSAQPGEPFAGDMPRTFYDLNSEQVKFWWPDGSITLQPIDWSLT